jgi:hypothetical protein
VTAMPSKETGVLPNGRSIAGNGEPSSHRGFVVDVPKIDAPQRAALRNFDPEIERGVMDVVRAMR